MTFLPRTAWAVHTPPWTPLPPTPHSVIHHTAARYTGTGLADLIGHLRQLELAEMGRGDHLIALAYHRMYAPDGTSIEARPIGAQGGATLNHNSDSRAYCFLGNFQTDTPTRAALLACAADIRADLRAGHLTGGGHPTWGHRDVFATACPGANLYPALPALRQLVLDTPLPAQTPEQLMAAYNLVDATWVPSKNCAIGVDSSGHVYLDPAHAALYSGGYADMAGATPRADFKAISADEKGYTLLADDLAHYSFPWKQ